MARRRFVAAAAGRSNRVTEWSPVLIESEGQALSATQSLGDSSTSTQILVRQTVVRWRGSAMVHMVASAANESIVVACGIVVSSLEAITAGAASLPSPLTQPETSFLWHQLFVFGPAIGAEIATDQAIGIATQRVEIDSKAQRILRPDQVVAFIWDAVIRAGSPTVEFHAAARNLILLT